MFSSPDVGIASSSRAAPGEGDESYQALGCWPRGTVGTEFRAFMRPTGREVHGERCVGSNMIKKKGECSERQ